MSRPLLDRRLPHRIHVTSLLQARDFRIRKEAEEKGGGGVGSQEMTHMYCSMTKDNAVEPSSKVYRITIAACTTAIHRRIITNSRDFCTRVVDVSSLE